MIDIVTPDMGSIKEIVGDNEGNSSDFQNNPYDYSSYYSADVKEEVPQAHPAAKAVLGLSYSLMIPVCGIGNLLLCYIIYRFRRMRSTTNLLIGNLAFSDFLVAVIVAPFNFYYYMNQDWPFGKAMCVTVAYLKAVSLYVSTNSLLVIAIDRYVIIMYPLRPRMTKCTAIIIMVFIWCVSMCLVIPTAIHTDIQKFYITRGLASQCLEYGWQNRKFLKGYTLTLTIVEFIAPMGIMSVVYFLIAVKLWYREIPGGHLTAQQEIEAESSKRKTVRMLIIVVALFAICWTPYYLVALLRDVAYAVFPEMQVTNHSLYLTIYYIVEMLAMSNSMFNTLIYIIFNANFRKHVKQLPDIWCGGKTESSTSQKGTRKYWLPLTTNSNVRSSMRSSMGRSIPSANTCPTRLKRERLNCSAPQTQVSHGNEYHPCHAESELTKYTPGHTVNELSKNI